MSSKVPESYLDANGNFVIQMRCEDLGMWSLITGQAAMVPRKFPWWKLWLWSSLLLKRRYYKIMAAGGPLDKASFFGTAKQDGNKITECEVFGVRFFGPE